MFQVALVLEPCRNETSIPSVTSSTCVNHLHMWGFHLDQDSWRMRRGDNCSGFPSSDDSGLTHFRREPSYNLAVTELVGICGISIPHADCLFLVQFNNVNMLKSVFQ